MQGAVLKAVFRVGETPTEVEHELPEINRKLSINYFVGTPRGTYGFDLFWHRGGLTVRHTPAFVFVHRFAIGTATGSSFSPLQEGMARQRNIY